MIHQFMFKRLLTTGIFIKRQVSPVGKTRRQILTTANYNSLKSQQFKNLILMPFWEILITTGFFMLLVPQFLIRML